MSKNIIGLLIVVTSIINLVSSTPSLFSIIQSNLTTRENNYGTAQLNRKFCTPLVIAHRGASGYIPEHTLGSYALAITMGADYIEPDLVMTKDGHLIARHDNELSLTTNVAQRSEFSSRFKTQTVDGISLSGWFTEDFTLVELKTLRAIERIPSTRPGNARMDLAYEIPTFQEIIDLVKGMEMSLQRPIGLYPEIKHSTHFRNLGLPLEQRLIEIFHLNGYRNGNAPVYIQSFEVDNLKELRKFTELPLLQLYEDDQKLQPFDQLLKNSSITYGKMATLEGLREVANYANAVGPHKNYIIPRDANNMLGNPTNFIEDAHSVGLKVHPYTFRAENEFLPEEFRSKIEGADAIGNLIGEIQMFINAGIDGLFSDQPDIPVRLRGNCY